MVIRDQAIIKYQGKWSATPRIPAPAVINLVSAALSKDGITVKDSSNDAGFFQSNSIPFIGASEIPFTVNLTLQVSNGMGFSSENDVISIVRHDVFASTGVFPTADSVPLIQNPNGIATSTGQPTVDQNQQPSGTSLIDSITSLFSDTKFVVIGVGLGLLVAVLMITSPKKLF